MSSADKFVPIRFEPTLGETEKVFEALAHGTRRHILCVLSHYGDELPSGYLAKRLPHAWPTTTRHLRVLEKAGLVEVRREGRSSFYRIQRDRMLRVIGTWLALLEPPSPTQTWRSTGRRSTKG